MSEALALLEFDSIAHGIAAGDAMVKHSPIEVMRAGTVHPGRFLVLARGAVAEVEEAVRAGREASSHSLIGVTMLPNVHPEVVDALRGRRREGGEALGIVETTSVAATIQAADAGVKGAQVVLRELRLADDLGGKGYLLLGGTITEVEAGVEHAVESLAGEPPGPVWRIIGQLHSEMDHELSCDARFHQRVVADGTSGIPASGSTDDQES